MSRVNTGHWSATTSINRIGLLYIKKTLITLPRLLLLNFGIFILKNNKGNLSQKNHDCQEQTGPF